jgi:outer membrane immunogenic protein
MRCEHTHLDWHLRLGFFIRLHSFEVEMRNSKFIVSASVAITAIVCVGAASAADLAARPYTKAAPMMVAMYDWSGFYIGANGGYGSSRKCYDLTALNGGGGLAPFAAPEGCHNATGGVAGGQVGYRWQSAAWVFGVEAQGDWANLTGSNSSLAFLPLSNRSTIKSFGLFTGQVGYSWNNALLYVKGGAAFANDKYNQIITATGQINDAASETRWGGAVGVGVEYGFTPNWSAALEYDHMFMGSHSNTFTGLVAPVVGIPTRTDSIRQDVDMITARVNYRFGGPVVARY